VTESDERNYFVHPQGLAESRHIGAGTRIWAFAHVLGGARVGAHCNICECVFVEDGAELGDHVTVKNGVQLWTGVTCEDYVFIGPNATFTNDLRPRVARPVDPADFARTRVCHGASIGANATIVAGTTIGRHAMVGAGTVVIRDVPAHALVVGNPARQIGWVCSCGADLEVLACSACGKQYREQNHGLQSV
jgi:acetyltransferase-like isoleucine patch superfamily enzyme